MTSEDLNLAGQGLRDVTRLASADPSLWSQILTENRKSIEPIIETMINQLESVKSCIKSSDEEGVKRFIITGNEGKKQIPGKHGAKNRGQETGLITLSLSSGDREKLSKHLQDSGFKVHPVKNR